MFYCYFYVHMYCFTICLFLVYQQVGERVGQMKWMMIQEVITVVSLPHRITHSYILTASGTWGFLPPLVDMCVHGCVLPAVCR